MSRTNLNDGVMNAVEEPSQKPARWDAGRITALILVLCTAVAFWPVGRWIFDEVAASQQIRQGFVLLGAAVGLVTWLHWGEWRLKLETGNRAIFLLFAAYAYIAVALWGNMPILFLPAFAMGLAGCLQILVGESAWRFVKPLVVAFVACIVVILLFRVVDWPLRQMAGVNAARILHSLGFTPQLSVIMEPAPKLILATGKNLFEVATECNGFGLITSGAILALLAGGIAGRGGWALAWLVPVAMLIGFTLNLLRILAICLLAPSFPNHYAALHETLGIIMLWSGLGLIGWLAWRPALAASRPAASR